VEVTMPSTVFVDRSAAGQLLAVELASLADRRPIVFGLPLRFIEYVLVHEQAHATRPGGRAHGRAWRRRMNRWMPDWEQRQSELAKVGRHAWLGDGQPRS